MTVLEVLSTLLPSIAELDELLAGIRKKYDIPEVLPEQRELVEALKSEKFYDWKIIRQEIEQGLREFLQPALAPLGINQLLQIYTDIISNSPQIKAFLMSKGLDVDEPVADRFVEGLRKNAEGGLEFMNQFYIKGSEKLLEHLRTGRPIDVPAEWVNIVFTFPIPPPNGERVVVAVAHLLNDPDEIADRFRKKIIDVFPEKPKITERDLETAEYLSMKRRGKSLEEITRVDVERHPEVLPGIEDGDVEFDRHRATINRRMLRLQGDVNRLSEGDKK